MINIALSEELPERGQLGGQFVGVEGGQLRAEPLLEGLLGFGQGHGPSGLETAGVRRVWQQRPVEISVAHSSKSLFLMAKVQKSYSLYAKR